ncbi:hypothetical protein [Pedobacter sp. SYP-B3415]|uniref:hypothetical protein n=1 Tax=Pedobacter sp. SYP-B3415 TaxID=2496641 RepID=UPI00101CE82E|nr:hypothetical protein [Pedobacter sp. SYP-B3415]
MKKYLTGLTLLLAACGSGYKHTVITEEVPGRKIRIEYRGDVEFSADSTAIRSMQPGATASYDRNGTGFEAKADQDGHIRYAYEGGDLQERLTGSEAEFMRAAIRDMVRLGRNRSRQ